MATGLARTILARSRDLMWDWTTFVNPFPDPITLTEEVHTCWSDARTKLGFPGFADATPPTNYQVITVNRQPTSYPRLNGVAAGHLFADLGKAQRMQISVTAYSKEGYNRTL